MCVRSNCRESLCVQSSASILSMDEAALRYKTGDARDVPCSKGGSAALGPSPAEQG